jgi:hypothetical protein
VNIAVHLEPATEPCPGVEYRWDADTDILLARLQGAETNVGMSGSVDFQGADGSWVILDVAGGRIRGVEVAVWPDVHKRTGLSAPATIEEGSVVIPSRASQPGIAAVEVEVPLMAEANSDHGVIHFRVGARRDVRSIRIGSDLLLDIDQQNRIAGLWLLNVPPSPSN